MRFSVLGFNQEKIVNLANETNTNIDLTDLLLLDYIQRACGQPSMIKEFKDGQSYVWLYHDKILKDLPILNIKSNMLSKRMKKLKDIDLIDYFTAQDKSMRGSRTYYTITEKTEALIYTEEETSRCNELHLKSTTTSNELHLKTGADVKNYTPNNKLNIDSKLNNDNKLRKDVSVLSRGIKKTSLVKEKTTFKDCFNQINSYTDDKELRTCLKDYLTLRIQMLKDKPMKATQWKYMIEKLDVLQEKSLPGTTKVDIVKNSIERQYATFYPLDGKYKKKADYKDVPMYERELIPHDGRYDNEDHTLSGEVF